MSEPADREEPPPLGSWSRWYALVVIDLLLTILLCGWLSRLAS
ncbi:MAG TPA: hypothetical protein VMJ70_09215 [Candidatus Sulfotelmatobacter sp.]|nr:hypothetical protein [Candidatus Sulfotelmatobacter sp.]